MFETAPFTYAASTILRVNPTGGSYPIGTPFSLDLVIDGHGDIFNAAKATVTVSQNAYVQGLTLGNCNFAFVATPTVTNPSFTGAILGGSSKSCTIYTLTLLPLSLGTGTITLTNAAVKSYSGAQDTLISLQNGSYTFTPSSNGSLAIPPPPKVASNSQQSPSSPTTPYTITVSALTSDNVPLSGVQVILDPSQSYPPIGNIAVVSPAIAKSTTAHLPSQIATAPVNNPSQTAITDKNGVAQFTSIPQGVHRAVIQSGNKKLADTIFSVNGTNHIITLGIKVQKQSVNLPLVFFCSVSALLILTFLLFLMRNTFVFKAMMKRKEVMEEAPNFHEEQ